MHLALQFASAPSLGAWSRTTLNLVHAGTDLGDQQCVPIREQLLDEFPWLRAADLDVDYDMLAEEEDGNEGDQEAEEEVVIDEEEYDRIRQEILEVRAAYRLGDEDKFFYVRQRGGDANVPKVGHALDCAALFARLGVATDFCVKYGFPKQKSYHYSTYGGEAPASKLITEFARKGHFCSFLGCLASVMTHGVFFF